MGGDIASSKVPLDQYCSLILRTVIDNNNAIIAIILIKNGLNIINVSIVIDIVPGGNNHTHRNLIVVLVDIVLRLVRFVLVVQQIFHLCSVVVSFGEVVVRILNVVERELKLFGVFIVLSAKTLNRLITFYNFCEFFLALLELIVLVD